MPDWDLPKWNLDMSHLDVPCSRTLLTKRAVEPLGSEVDFSFGLSGIRASDPDRGTQMCFDPCIEIGFCAVELYGKGTEKWSGQDLLNSRRVIWEMSNIK